MDFSRITTGLSNVWEEVLRFLAGVKFARPEWLWLSLLPLAVTVVAIVAERWRKRQVTEVGRPGAIAGLLLMRPTKGRLARFLLGLAWSALMLGAAGPRWGKSDDGGVAVGRDMVVVIDLSRSMTVADLRNTDPRWVAAVNGAKDLIATARTRGGHRIGLVVFGAKAKVFAPLTTDYDYLDQKLDQLIEAGGRVNDLRPTDDSIPSGTRIGAAMKLAVETHDPRFPGSQDVVLLTDADDPEPDREWELGITAARTAGIPVHVVGIGSPSESTEVKLPGRVGEDGQPELILSRLEEDVAREIARDGRGQYLSSRTAPVPPLGEFFRTHIEPNPTRTLTDDTGTHLRDRSVWFFTAAGLLLLLGWLRER